MARKIDAMIQEQPAVSKEQAATLHPVVSIAEVGRRVKAVRPGWVWSGPDAHRFAVDYTISLPANQKIADLRAYLIDSSGKKEKATIAHGTIRPVALESTGTIQLTIVTTGLVVTTVEQEVTFLDEPVPQ